MNVDIAIHRVMQLAWQKTTPNIIPVNLTCKVLWMGAPANTENNSHCFGVNFFYFNSVTMNKHEMQLNHSQLFLSSLSHLII